MKNPLKPAHALLLTAVTCIWGSNFVVIKLALNSFDPMLLAVIRFAASALPLALLLPRPAIAWRWMALNGLLSGTGQFGLLFLALRADITPGMASLLMQTQVFSTIVLAALTFGERVTLRQCAGLLLGALGLATVGLHVDASLTLLGLALVLAAATCWAASNLVVKFAARRAAAEATAAAPRLDMLAFVVWSNGFACLAMLPVMFMTVGAQQAGQQLLGATPVAWAAGLWQALGNTLIGFVAWSAMLARYPAAVVTPWALLVPVFGMTASVWLLGEPLPAWKIVAGVLVLAGIAVTTWPRRMPA